MPKNDLRFWIDAFICNHKSWFEIHLSIFCDQAYMGCLMQPFLLLFATQKWND